MSNRKQPVNHERKKYDVLRKRASCLFFVLEKHSFGVNLRTNNEQWRQKENTFRFLLLNFNRLYIKMISIIVVQLCCFLLTTNAHVEDCIGQQCSEVVSIPLLDNMKATLKADLDVAELNRVLHRYIQQEVIKVVKGTFDTQMERAVEQITDNVTRLTQSNVNAAVEKCQGKVSYDAFFLSRISPSKRILYLSIPVPYIFVDTQTDLISHKFLYKTFLQQNQFTLLYK